MKNLYGFNFLCLFNWLSKKLSWQLSTSKFRVVEDGGDDLVNVVDGGLKETSHGVLGQSQHAL